MTPLRKGRERGERTTETGNGHHLVTRRTDTILDPFQRFFGNFGILPTFGNFGSLDVTGPWRHPAVDIRDLGNEYEVRAELPGVSRSQVECGVTDDRLEIKAESTAEKEEDEAGYYHRETSRQSFFRTVPLPPDANPDAIDAKMEDGVLRVTIGKQSGGGTRRRSVKVR